MSCIPPTDWFISAEEPVQDLHKIDQRWRLFHGSQSIGLLDDDDQDARED